MNIMSKSKLGKYNELYEKFEIKEWKKEVYDPGILKMYGV